MATAKLVWWILIGVAVCICVALTSIAYIETQYMKAQLKKDHVRIDKKIAEIEKLKQELKDAK